MKVPVLAPLVAVLFLVGCAPSLTRLPTVSGRAEGPAPPTRLDPEVMSRYLGAQLLLAGPQGEGAEVRAEEAAVLIQEALGLQPATPQLWQALAEARARSGDYAAASAAARQAVVLDPDDGRSRYLLG